MEELERAIQIALHRQDARQGRLYLNQRGVDELARIVRRKANPYARGDGVLRYAGFRVCCDDELDDLEFGFDPVDPGEDA